MGLFSFSRKNKQEPASGDSEFYSRADEESTAVRSRSKRKDKQSNEPVDPVLPDKKRARRRLVGAIALVLAAVIGLPMIFDSEPKPFADDITIQIPSKDKSANKRNDTSQPVSPAASAISRTDASASLDPKEELVTPSSSAGVTTAAMVTAGAAATTAAVVTKVGNQPSASTKPTVVDKNADKVQVAEAKPEAKSEAKQTQKPNAKADSKTEPKTVAAVDQKSNDGSKAKDKAKEATANSDGSKAATDRMRASSCFKSQH